MTSTWRHGTINGTIQQRFNGFGREDDDGYQEDVSAVQWTFPQVCTRRQTWHITWTWSLCALQAMQRNICDWLQPKIRLHCVIYCEPRHHVCVMCVPSKQPAKAIAPKHRGIEHHHMVKTSTMFDDGPYCPRQQGACITNATEDHWWD